ncbi:hypothetical protein F0L74_29595 [Chitinophaga agrisoli]|uniref:Uncharacterized protein n=1 Tax=Chitinophaga agrisoli TaxID=2607653 RepID=A0A5B2VQ23_9BACT|nr:hypothetical protein [Chitinophaga agrisoli]KAA2240317.1 hypothetical protein F0L74_29595 [Chitinophaga agrisoli]
MTLELAELLGKQYLIAAYVEKKIQLVNYIKDGYDKDLPILINNRFLHFTAHINYRSVIVDLYALYGPFGRNNKYSFFRILEPEYEYLIASESRNNLRLNLSNLSRQISTIKNLRHKQIAHYDFEQTESINLNFDNLLLVNGLFESAKEILKQIGMAFVDESLTTSYDFGRRHLELDSLTRLTNSKNRDQI